MNTEKIKALALELAKDIKTPDDLRNLRLSPAFQANHSIKTYFPDNHPMTVRFSVFECRFSDIHTHWPYVFSI
ncbi:MAG: hypothetical protein KAG53_11270 [Endozoicomonadaceae bacterium]|nr:hypothetical protein [Endozoicomonadaceae bacterium]